MKNGVISKLYNLLPTELSSKTSWRGLLVPKSILVTSTLLGPVKSTLTNYTHIHNHNSALLCAATGCDLWILTRGASADLANSQWTTAAYWTSIACLEDVKTSSHAKEASMARNGEDKPDKDKRKAPQSIYDIQLSEASKVFLKKYRTPIASGASSIISTFIAVSELILSGRPGRS